MASTATQQISLSRLLTRLDASLLSPTSTLPNTAHHRARIAANLEHARALHLTAEKSVATQRIPSQRQSALEELARQREWIQRLEAKLRALGEVGDDDDDESSDDEDDGEGEDLLRVYAPARKAVEGAGLEVQSPQAQSQPELRSRKRLGASDNRSAATSSAREELFSARTTQQDADSTRKTETIMSNNRTEQEALTTGLLGLAAALKQSSLNFSSSLEAERDVMKRAEGGLDKNAQGMEAAGKRMGTLRRMSEGQGWWGRIKLYGFIFGLWVACFLLVFIGPKLRF